MKVLYDASRYVEFKDGKESASQAGFTGEIQSLTSGCAYRGDEPIKIYKQRLRDFGISDAQIEAIDAESMRKVEEATVACKAAPQAPLELLTADVYADGGWAWRN